MGELLERGQIATEDTWNLESVYASDDQWETHFSEMKKRVEGFGVYRGKVRESLSCLKAVLDEAYAIERNLGRLMVYAKMRSDQDTSNTFYQNLSSRAASLGISMDAASAFLRPEILSWGEEALKEALAKEEGLSAYARPILEMIRTNAHTKDEGTEALLADAGEMAEAPHKIFNVFLNADLSFPDAVLSDGTRIPVTNSSLVTWLESDNRELRREVFGTYYAQLRNFGNTMAGLLEGNVKQAIFFSKARNFTSSRAMYLDRSNIPEQVYDNLIGAVHRALPSMYRYVALRRKILGLDELHMYDVYTPLSAAGSRKYTIEEAKRMVKEGLAPLGEEYLEILQEGFDSRWIDVYPNRGKRGGAYSWGCYDSQPFVLMNYQGTLDNVFTLAHEMGHSIHSWYSRRNQPYQTADYKIFVAEVASTCNEALLITDMLAKTTDPEERRYLLNHFLDTFKGTLFRQTMFAEFELKIHRMGEQGIPLTADLLNQTYLELNRLYFGPDMVSDPEIACEWMRIPHFYTPFYVYQYATGFSAAIALSGRILREGASAVEDYKKFLKGGSSLDPIDLLKLAGVDITQEQPVEDALRMFDGLVKELEELA